MGSLGKRDQCFQFIFAELGMLLKTSEDTHKRAWVRIALSDEISLESSIHLS